MKFILSFLLLFVSIPAIAVCIWSEPFPIPNDNRLKFQECKSEKKIRLNQIVVKPNIDFEIVHSHYPEGNTIWSQLSPNKNTVVVWIENSNYERNAWVINLSANEVEMFIDHAEGRHFNVEFTSNEKFTIIHAGMGYRVDFYYERTSGVWKNMGHKNHDIKL